MLVMMIAAALLTQQPPSSSDFATAAALLDRRLLDYPTARFRDVRGDDRILCGFVNGKNRMGAYTGWSRFAVLLFSDDPRVLVDDVDGRDDILLDTFCGDDGMKLTGVDYSDRLTAG